MSNYKIKNLEHYFKAYKKSIKEPKKFWEKIADEHFTWYRKWDKVLEYSMQEAEFKWFDVYIAEHNGVAFHGGIASR